MQRLRVALWLVFVVLLSGCGDDPPKATGPAALKHAPADADAVLVVPTDLQGEQLQRLNTLLSPIFRGAVARTDFSTWDSDPLGLETVPLGEAVGELEASREGIDARLRIAIK
jgi:hypothetical protein